MTPFATVSRRETSTGPTTRLSAQGLSEGLHKTRVGAATGKPQSAPVVEPAKSVVSGKEGRSSIRRSYAGRSSGGELKSTGRLKPQGPQTRKLDEARSKHVRWVQPSRQFDGHPLARKECTDGRLHPDPTSHLTKTGSRLCFFACQLVISSSYKMRTAVLLAVVGVASSQQCTPVLPSLGCYNDQSGPHVVNVSAGGPSQSMTLESCAASCFLLDLQLMGLTGNTQDGAYCYCGNTTDPAAKPAPGSACNLPCPGSNKEICGGNYRMVR